MPRASAGEADAPDLKRYLPHALIATTAVAVLPALAVTVAQPSGSAAYLLLSIPIAMGLSVAAAAGLSALWATRRGSSDVVFSDLMLWNFVRRLKAERGLDEAARRLDARSKGDGHQVLSADLVGESLRAVSRLLELSDPYMSGHTRRIARYCEQVAERMALEPQQVAQLETAAALHGIGLINAPMRIVNKPGPLTPDELALVRHQALDGASMVSETGDVQVTAIIRHQYERFDGSGYPDGLAGDQIPLGARIIAVADAFDAMTSPRPYRERRSQSEALRELSSQAGTQFDPAVVSAFVRYCSGERSAAWSAFLVAVPQRLVGWIAGLSTGVGGGSLAGAGAALQGAAVAGVAALAAGAIGGGATAPAERPESVASGGSGQTQEAPTPSSAESRAESRAPRQSTAGAKQGGSRGDSGADGQDDSGAAPGPGSDVQGAPVAPGSPPRSGPAQPGPGSDPPAPTPRPESPVPGVQIPDVKTPEVKTPEVTVPDVKVPAVPQLGIPEVEVPGLQVPQLTVPSIELPLPDAVKRLPNLLAPSSAGR